MNHFRTFVYIALVACASVLANFYFSTYSQHSWVILSAFAFLFVWQKPSFFLTIVMLGASVLIASLSITSWLDVRSATLFILLGAIIVVCARIVFLPKRKQYIEQMSLIRALYQLNQLTQTIFTCFLQLEYIENIYLYEHRLHLQKNKWMQALALLKQATYPTHKNILQHIERINDITFDCALLRTRITDYTVLNVCHRELIAINDALKQVYDRMIKIVQGKEETVDLTTLDDHIRQLEDNYQHVLQVSAREPLVFMLFVSSLKSLHDELLALRDGLFEVSSG